MRLIVGLGNPGHAYIKNRHNVGHMAIDLLTDRGELKNAKLTKTNTFMNQSGDFVKKIIDEKSLETQNLYIIHDDLDISLGSYKIQFGRGPKVHNGLNSIYEKLGTKEFWHVRVGVDNRNPDSRTKGEEYVLEDFTPEESILLEKTLKSLCKELVNLLK